MGPYWAFLVVRRIFRAAKMLFLLVKDRELVREMPWAAIRHRMKTRKVLLFQAFVFVAVLIGMPISAARPALNWLFSVLALLWVAALVLPWVSRLVLAKRG